MIMNSGIDGITTYRRISEFKPHQKTVIASGLSINKHVDELREFGGNLYIKKPYSIKQIAEAVKTALSSTSR